MCDSQESSNPNDIAASKNNSKLPEPKETFEKSEPPLKLGSCILRHAKIAQIVQDSLLFFEDKRYHLGAWCIMPNHVHIVIQPFADYKLKDILHSLKSFTSTAINQFLLSKGSLWERESLDHLIRRSEHIEEFVYYTEQNPVAANFVACPKDWPFSSCGAGFQPAPLEFSDPRQTPFIEPYKRGELPHLHKEGGIYFVTWRLLDAVALNKL